MDSTGRFLLGSVVGAALGYLLSQKNVQKALQELAAPLADVVPPAVPTAVAPPQAQPAPAAVAEAPAVSVFTAPVVEAQPVVEAAPVVEAVPVVEPAAAPVWEPMPGPAVEPAPYVEAVEAPAVEAPAEEPQLSVEAPYVETLAAQPAGYDTADLEIPVVELPIAEDAEAALLAEEAAETIAPMPEVPESEVIVTDFFLEEPLPGAGWEAPAALAVEEETFEDVLPAVPAEFQPYAGPEVERAPVQGEGGRPATPVWSEALVEESAVEELVAEEPRAESAVEDLAPEEPPADMTVAEAEELSVVELEAPLVEIEVEPLVEAFEEEAAPVMEAPPAETAAVAETAPVDDLKARIEETRRRIRRELEQPFVSAEPAPTTDEDWTISPAVPAAAGSALAEPAEAAAEESLDDITVDVGEAPEVEEIVDYDAMRSRIEQTRSRLKAKAFDAMMTGESALLGRDEEDAAHRKKVATGVDSEVDETIETSLREEED